ncbi:MAG: molybdopterin molybdotransferase MoeA [Burkholderiales bacterium]|nr:molybdopterin molybdotransferase MoeA [Burkholderiales bacterium]
MLSMDEALAALLAQATPVAEHRTVPTLSAHGRVLAAPLHSTLDVPPMDNTSMDGYALRAADVPAAGTRLPVSQRVPAGQVPSPLAAGTAARIFTGAMIPPGADAVVMQEQCSADGDAVVVNHVPAAGDWVRRAGEDIRAGARILAAGTRLSPQACGLAASVGLATVPVVRDLRVAVFFTGDELAMPGESLKPGAIYNSNRFVLSALIAGLGCRVTDFGIVPDSLDATRGVLREAAREHDLIVTTGGVSVGEEDHVRPAVEAEGEIRLWQIAIKPGKPLAYGRVRRAPGGHADFIGLPGNPVSGFVTFLLFVRPFILKRQGVADLAPRALALRADFDWPRPDRRREFLRARQGAAGLELFPNQSSGVLTSTVWADGLIDNPPGHAIARGDLVRFLPFAALLT